MADECWTVITGASAGIGTEFARAFARRGCGLVLVARRKERLDALAAELAASHDVPVRVFPMDLENPDAPLALVRALDDEGIAVHTLVNNAGFGLRGRFASLPEDRQLAMVQLNVMALTALSRLVLPGLIARKTGGIINVASLSAFQAGPFMAVYYASKAYALSLSEALHEEAKPFGVTVTAVCPGPVPTEFSSVADLQGTRIKKLPAVSAAEVVSAAISAYEARRAIVIPGWSSRFAMIGAKFAPRAIARRVAASIQRVK
jgi:short-subunit dehydrogenase